MGFKKGLTYILVDAKGLASSHFANEELVKDILDTGGKIIPHSVSERGDVIGVDFIDGSFSAFATLWADESRFFKIEYVLNKRTPDLPDGAYISDKDKQHLSQKYSGQL